MNNEQQKGQSFEKNKVPPSAPQDKKEFKKDVKQKDTEADEDTGACGSSAGSCGTSSDDEE
jgi:hypothetical protein